MFEFKIKPFDVLYFGSTKPFSIGDVTKSDYFPTSYKLASAICFKLYQAFKIDPNNIIKSFYGPFIEYNKKLYFHKPHNIYKTKSKYSKYTSTSNNNYKYFILLPVNLEKTFEIFKFYNNDNSNKDLNEGLDFSFKSYFLYIGQEEVESFNAFISIQALEKYIKKLSTLGFYNIKNFNQLDNVISFNNKDNDNNDDDDILEVKNILDFDQRIGIKLDDNTRNVLQESGLYRIEFLTLKENLNYVFYIEFHEENLRNQNITLEKLIEFLNNNRNLKLGGEGKFSYYQFKKQKFYNILNYYSEVFKNAENKETIKKILNKDYIFVIFLNIGYYKDYEELKQAISYKFPGFSIESIIFDELMIVGKYKAKIEGKISDKKSSKKVLPPGTVLFLTKNNYNYLNKDDLKNNDTSRDIKVGIDFLINKDNLLDSEFIGSNLVIFF